MADHIVFFGRNPSIMALVKYQLARAGMQAEGFLDDDALVARLDKGGVSLLVLGGGVEEEARADLRNRCKAQGIKLLEHFGGPDQLLAKVRAALAV